MALAVRQPNEPPPETYWDMLYKSEDTLTPFNKKSTVEEITKKLKEFHSAASTKHLTSDIIKALLENRKERLQKIIAYIDIEVSPRSLNLKFISDLRVDFSTHIDAVIDNMPALDRYIGDGEYVKEKFLAAGSALDNVLDALDTLGELKSTDIEEKINEKTKAYTALHEATHYFEEGLSKWDIQPARFEKNLAEYVTASTADLKKQIEEINHIRTALRNRVTALPPVQSELEKFERKLRKEILVTLLAIPEQILPDGDESQEIINNSGIHTYIFEKPNVIKALREAKNALNLALDRYELTKPPARVGRGGLNTHINSCITSLDTIRKDLEQND